LLTVVHVSLENALLVWTAIMYHLGVFTRKKAVVLIVPLAIIPAEVALNVQVALSW